MRKLLLLPLVAVFLFLPTAATADIHLPFLPNLGVDGNADAQIMVAICHIPPGNPANAHIDIVGAAALAAHLAHGDIHLGTGLRADLRLQFGHEGDKIPCGPAVTTTTTAPSTTTTTAPVVTTTTLPSVTVTTQAPVPPVVTPVAPTGPADVATPAPVTPAVLTELPRTGGMVALLAGLGVGLAALGLLLRRLVS